MSGLLGKALERFSETMIDDEIVVMQTDSGVFFSLNGTARRIWELIDGTRDQAALLAALAAEFGADQKEIAAETAAFIKQLHEAGLVMID